MNDGKLVPDEIMIGIVREVLASPRAAGGFILDGFPRTLPQAKALSRIFKDLDIHDFKVVDIRADDEEIIRRLSSRLVCPAAFPFASYTVPDRPITPPSAVAIRGQSLGTIHRTFPAASKETMAPHS